MLGTTKIQERNVSCESSVMTLPISTNKKPLSFPCFSLGVSQPTSSRGSRQCTPKNQGNIREIGTKHHDMEHQEGSVREGHAAYNTWWNTSEHPGHDVLGNVYRSSSVLGPSIVMITGTRPAFLM